MENKNRLHLLPETGFLRLPQIIGQRAISVEEAERNQREAKAASARGEKPSWKPKCQRESIPALIPISRASWLAGVQSGKYPPAIKLGPRTTVWSVESIRALIEQHLGSGA